MLVRKLKDCAEFVAGDNTMLREMLHPDKEELALRYSLAYAVVKPGMTSWLHALTTSEVYYIIEGEGVMHINGESAPVGPDDTIYIPPHARQCITNTGTVDLKFLCIVDPAWRKEDEVILRQG
jgi:mannose-6-phosphate isomerase-like protein (cupin superfamily)